LLRLGFRPQRPLRRAYGQDRTQVKQRIARQSVRTRDDLKRVALSALRSLQQMPEKIRGFFRDPAYCYAATKVQVALLIAPLVTCRHVCKDYYVGT